MTAFQPTTRIRVQIAAHEHGWTQEKTFLSGPQGVTDVFTRPSPDGGVDVFTVSFQRGRFATAGRRDNVPVDPAQAEDRFWHWLSRGRLVAFEGHRSPKGRVERVIAAFA